jgi:hypothetical protein
MRGEQAGQEVTHDGAKVEPGFTGRKPPTGRAHGEAEGALLVLA